MADPQQELVLLLADSRRVFVYIGIFGALSLISTIIYLFLL